MRHPVGLREINVNISYMMSFQGPNETTILSPVAGDRDFERNKSAKLLLTLAAPVHSINALASRRRLEIIIRSTLPYSTSHTA